MREIKFRAWDLKEKEMIDSITFDTLFSFAESAELNFWLDNKNHITMQYTWLKDKNWKEIYDGDIMNIEWFTADVIFYWWSSKI